MSILRRLETRGADPTLPWGSSAIPTNGQIGLSAAGVPMNEDMAMSISTVFACVKALADDVSTLPLNAYIRAKDHTHKVVSPTPAVITNPWPEGTLQDWLSQAVYSLALRGNFYGRIVDRDYRGYPTIIQPLHPDDITARRNSAGQREYRLQGRLIPLDEIFHIPALTPPGGFVGMNPIEYMRSSWGLTAAAERYGGAFFANSANPSGVIEVAEDLDETETLELARAWKQAHQGIGNAQYPAVLTGGATWKPVSINPDDAQFLQTRDFQRVEIAGWFGVPLHRLGLQDRTSSWGAGIEQMELGYLANTLAGWLGRFENYLSRSDMTPSNMIVKFDLTARLRGDTLQRFQAYTLARNGGWLNIDEIREREDLPELPKGQGKDYWAPLNFAPITNIKDGTAGSSGGQGGGIDQSPDAPTSGSAGAALPAEQRALLEGRVVVNPHFTIRIPEQPAPAAPDVRVDVAAPVVNVPPPAPVTRRVVRDEQNRIVQVVEE